MRIINMLLRFALAAAVAAAVGCGSESSMKVSSDLPNTDSATGRTNIVSPKRDITKSIDEDVDGTKPYAAGYQKRYCEVYVTKDLDPATVTPANVYIRDIAGTPIKAMTSDVKYIDSTKAIRIEYSLTTGAGGQTTTSAVELTISRNVTDREGNQFAGYGHSGYKAYANVPLDFRTLIFNAPLIASPVYAPLYVTGLSITAISSTQATVRLDLNRNVNKSALLTSLFTITGGGAVDTATITYSTAAGVLYANWIRFNITTLSANTMYDIAVNVSGLTIYNADNLYPDGTTAVFTDTTANFMDLHAYENFYDKRNSDFHTRFATPVTDTTSLIWVYVDPTAFGSDTLTVFFVDPADNTCYVNPDTAIAANFIAYTDNGTDYVPVQVEATKYYDTTGTDSGVYAVEISTAELGGETIDRLMVLNNVVAATPSSSTPEAIDGNQDGSRLGTVDITGDGVVDDDNWRSW